jgi:hypothetical protein
VFACGAALVQLLSFTPVSALRALEQLRTKITSYFIFSTNIIPLSINKSVFTVLLRCFKKKGVFYIKNHFVCLQEPLTPFKMRFKSALLTQASGKLGGAVASHNGTTQYFRKLTKPNNPRSSSQLTVRNNFTINSQAWRGLTDAQRFAWKAASINFPSKNKLGSTITLHGNNLYQRINNNLLNISQPVISVPPLATAVTALTTLSVSASATASTMTAAFTPGPVPAGYSMIIQAAAPQSAGRSNVNSKFRNIIIEAAAAASPANIYAAYIAKFGSIAVGNRIFIRAKLVNITTGLESQYLTASTLAV